MKNFGKVIEPVNCNIREHERKTARALASSGRTVEVVEESETKSIKNPDIRMCGHLWEIKSPTSSKLSQIEKNLKKANRQS